MQAQDVYSNTVSAMSHAMGGVYVPSSSGVLDALNANPAGLSTLSARSLEFAMAGVFARGSFSNSVNQNVSLDTNPGVVPAGAFGMPIGHSRFSIGAGLIPDLSSMANWTLLDAPGTAGASYGTQKYVSQILALRAVAGVSFSLTPALSVGATLGGDYNSNKLEGPSVFQTDPALAGLKTLLNSHTTGLGWNYGFGILASPSHNITVGAAWRSSTAIDSHGTAIGDLSAQLAALGMSVRPDFQYSAHVPYVLPQSVTGHMAGRVHARWLLAFQTNWVNWKNAFNIQTVELSNGNNAGLNALLGRTSVTDRQPLNWKNQITFHGGFARLITKSLTIRGGYQHGNSPVPNSTLTPLTAGIMKDRLTTGLGYRHGRARFDLAYSFGLRGHASVGQSAMLAGEYSYSRIGIGTQALMLTTSIQFLKSGR